MPDANTASNGQNCGGKRKAMLAYGVVQLSATMVAESCTTP